MLDARVDRGREVLFVERSFVETLADLANKLIAELLRGIRRLMQKPSEPIRHSSGTSEFRPCRYRSADTVECRTSLRHPQHEVRASDRESARPRTCRR